MRPLAACTALLFAATGHAATTHLVTRCDDTPALCTGDDGTLRQAWECSGDGDTIDLRQLQCSRITLTGPLQHVHTNVTLLGPGRDKLTLDGGGQSQIIGVSVPRNDTLRITAMTLANGRYDNPYTYGYGGGCVYTAGNLELDGVTVSNCYTSAVGTVATGGAIFAKGNVVLNVSTVSNSTAKGRALNSPGALGGGVRAHSVSLFRSTITGNIATTTTGTPALGGGVYAETLVSNGSTVSSNGATYGGGLSCATSCSLLESTISGNTATSKAGGIFAGKLGHGSNGRIAAFNSTIAFNTALPGSPGGILTYDLLSPTFQSSIVANNTGFNLYATSMDPISGDHNLILSPVHVVALPPDTVLEDPQLAALADNGGSTKTHALLPGSPAIDRGSNPQLDTQDQRDAPRTVGTGPDIGAFEYLDRLFANGFDPP